LDKQIVIKKYSNRRLYDTTHKRYVTLDDIASLIREGHEIKVIDSQTGEDITKIILIQVIWEGEKNKQDILPTSFLHMLIKYGNQIAREFFENYFLMMFQPYLTFQEKMSKNLVSLKEFPWLPPSFGTPPSSARSEREEAQGKAEAEGAHEPPPDERPSEDTQRELKELKAKLERLESVLKELEHQEGPLSRAKEGEKGEG